MTKPIAKRSLASFIDTMRARHRRVPLQGTVETTFRCNLACVHCYVNESATDPNERERELPLSRLQTLIDEVAERGCLELLLTGGEVLVRPDFEALYRYAVSKGLLVILFTNGTMVTDAVAQLLGEHKPLRVEITLYGMTRETYERVTQVPGSFDKCIAGIERLRARGVPLKLKTMALSWNQHEVAAMREYAHSLGLEFKFDGFLNPRVDCGSNRNAEVQLSPEQLVALDLADPQRMAEFKAFCERFVAPPEQQEPREHVYTCGAGATSFTVDPYGHMQLCQLSRKANFDLTRNSFAEGWDSFFPMLRARKWQSNSVCRQCNLLALCASCPGAAEMENGDVESMVAHFCEATHLRAFQVMGEKTGHRQDASCCLGHSTKTDVTTKAVRQSSGCGSSCGACAPKPLVTLKTPQPK
jgi:radical SAM protein with 4Fe4S-binding SPASM domain